MQRVDDRLMLLLQLLLHHCACAVGPHCGRVRCCSFLICNSAPLALRGRQLPD
jgi:hypothetical protein